MKKLIIIGICFICVSMLAAQGKTLISGDLESGGYGGVHLRLSQLNGEIAILTGWRGAWIVNKTFCVGWSSMEQISDDNIAPVLLDGRQGYLDMEYRGLLLGVMIGSDRLVHFGMDAVIGWGGVHYRLKENDDNYETDQFFVLTPEINLEVNVVSWFRIAVSGGYRLITEVQMEGLTGRDLSGFTGGLTLKFGKF